jgi:DNA-binding GntR family transcriptional regulator
MAEAVIKNSTSADIAKMRAACDSAARNDFGPQMYFEHGLHGVYIRVGENRFLEHLYMRGMALLNVLYIHGLRACTDENWILEYRKQHHQEELDIIAAIEARDLARLKHALTLHINNFRDFILMTVRSWPPKGLNWNRERELENDYA